MNAWRSAARDVAAVRPRLAPRGSRSGPARRGRRPVGSGTRRTSRRARARRDPARVRPTSRRRPPSTSDPRRWRWPSTSTQHPYSSFGPSAARPDGDGDELAVGRRERQGPVRARPGGGRGERDALRRPAVDWICVAVTAASLEDRDLVLAGRRVRAFGAPPAT